ncbi:MAG: NAD(P)H-hydrate epimerase, partial [Gemmatimonadota bacterium]
MAALDRRAVEEGHTTERTLIETAGREVARLVEERWPRGRVVGVLGSGHNGADGLVALRTLRAWGREVAVVIGGSSPPEPDVSAGWDMPCRDLSESDPDRLREFVGDAAVLLDGLLGTGVTGAPREPQAGLIDMLNGLRQPVVAVDGPSGMDFTTGAVPGACVDAALTVALGWPKLGQLLGPARERCGELVAVEIGFPPPEAPGRDPAAWARAATGRWVREILPRRPPDAHKGDAGYLTVVAGREGMAGASVLAARSAGRGGAGIVRVVGDPANRVPVQTAAPDALFTGWDDPEGVADAVSWADALVVGPGLGRGRDRRELVEAVLASRGDRPVLLDADGLNAFAGDIGSLSERLASRDLVTPHPGELARLLEVGVDEVLADPVERAR